MDRGGRRGRLRFFREVLGEDGSIHRIDPWDRVEVRPPGPRPLTKPPGLMFGDGTPVTEQQWRNLLRKGRRNDGSAEAE